MSDRLPAHLEVAGLLREAQAQGGFGAVLHKGDRDSGAILVVLATRGAPVFLLERRLSADFTYRWNATDASEQGQLNRWHDQPRIDPDCWLIELDIPDAQRFVAEMTDRG